MQITFSKFLRERHLRTPLTVQTQTSVNPKLAPNTKSLVTPLVKLCNTKNIATPATFKTTRPQAISSTYYDPVSLAEMSRKFSARQINIRRHESVGQQCYRTCSIHSVDTALVNVILILCQIAEAQAMLCNTFSGVVC